MDKRFIDQERRYKRMIRELTPHIYAAFVIALYRDPKTAYLDADDIAELLAETQQIWNESARGELDIIKECEDLTGISMLSEITAREMGVEGDRI